MGCSSSAGANADEVTLGYWNIRGLIRGGTARQLLAYCRVPYQEKTYTLDATFAAETWGKDKQTIMPFANLPYIIDGKVKISQTLAVHQYIVGKWKPEMLGKTPQERAERYRL